MNALYLFLLCHQVPDRLKVTPMEILAADPAAPKAVKLARASSIRKR
ncbi:MAG: hypothetical protein ACUVWN_00025 [bacterium]